MKRYEIAIAIATLYLFIYLLAFVARAPLWVVSLLFMLSPIPVLYMVWQILVNGEYNGPGLNGEEFGYQDVDKNLLGTF